MSRGQVWLRFAAGVLCIVTSAMLFMAQAEMPAAWLLMMSGVLFGIVAIVDAVKARQAQREEEEAGGSASSVANPRRVPHAPGR